MHVFSDINYVVNFNTCNSIPISAKNSSIEHLVHFKMVLCLDNAFTMWMLRLTDHLTAMPGYLNYEAVKHHVTMKYVMRNPFRIGENLIDEGCLDECN